MKKTLALKDLYQRYSSPRNQDQPEDFYSRSESQALLKALRTRATPLKPFRANYRYITTPAQLRACLRWWQGATVVGLDCETTGLDSHADQLRLVQIAVPQKPVAVIDVNTISQNLDPLRSLLGSDCLKVGHNLKFDLQFLQAAGIEVAPPYFDTYLAAKVLWAGLKKNNSLGALAKRLLRLELDKGEQKGDFSKALTSAQLQYAANDAAVVLPLQRGLQRQLATAKLLRTARIEFACLSAVARMERRGIYLDLERWGQLGEKLKQQQQLLQQQIEQQLPPASQQRSLLPELTASFNLRSPQQVIAALSRIGIEVKTTSATTLVELAPDCPAVRTLIEYRRLSTCISTFIDGLPERVHPVTGRLHGNWFQLGAKSGRFSCRHPNLTNIPRDSQLRSCFRAEPGNVLIKADYSQIELRLIASVSGDRRLRSAYCQNRDLHRLTAALIFNKPLVQISLEERRLGKVINFGLVYGMGLSKFRTTCALKHGIYLSHQEASRFRCRFFEVYQGVKGYHDRVRRDWTRGMRSCRTPDGRRRLWHDQLKLSEAINHPIQGANATIIKRALFFLDAALAPLGAGIIAVIHDEVLVECPVQNAERAATKIEKTMIKAAADILAPIPVEVEVQIAPSWGG